jgi:short-subunit dehydrogenase
MPNRNILITGASRGIGKQLALRYAATDSQLILVARNYELLREVSQQCRQRGATVIFEALDVRDASAAKSFMLQIDKTMPIDLVIANAGVSSMLQKGWQPELEEEQQLSFAVNLQGALNIVNPLIDRMIMRRKGHVAFTSSLAGFRGLPQSPSYCAAKGAIHIYGQALASWLKRYNINVSVIYPGYVKTDMSDRLSGPKPFMLSSEQAAELIQKGLDKKRRQIIFPWQLYILLKLARVLPIGIADMIIHRFEPFN